MAVTGKKSAKNTKAKPRRSTVKKATANQTKGLQSVKRELADALEQQAATSEILRMIARSPGDLQSTLDAIAKIAASLCDATDAAVWRVDGALLRLTAWLRIISRNGAKTPRYLKKDMGRVGLLRSWWLGRKHNPESE
jgi:hypothetical protein